jgi:hypothetical protein
MVAQPWQHIKPSQVWQAPMNVQQLSLPQASIDNFNLPRKPINYLFHYVKHGKTACHLCCL